MLGFFATFLKKGSAKTFNRGTSNNIVRSTVELTVFALHLILSSYPSLHPHVALLEFESTFKRSGRKLRVANFILIIAINI